MIKFKINDLLKLIDNETGDIYFSAVNQVNENNSNQFGFYDDFMKNGHNFDIITAWRYDETTGNYLEIYNKHKPCPDAVLDNCKDVKPTDIAYDKYSALLYENEELKNIIVELNKKIYRRDDGE